MYGLAGLDFAVERTAADFCPVAVLGFPDFDVPDDRDDPDLLPGDRLVMRSGSAEPPESTVP